MGLLAPQCTWDILSGWVLPQGPGETKTETPNERKGGRQRHAREAETKNNGEKHRESRGRNREREGERRRNTELGK